MAEARAEREAAAAASARVRKSALTASVHYFERPLPTFPFRRPPMPAAKLSSLSTAAVRRPLLRALYSAPELAFDYLRFISGVDQMDEGIEIVYSLWSYTKRHSLFVKTLLPLASLRVPSVAAIWAGADWHERETAEMFGVIFDGHPELKHLLLDDDMDIHPLLKAHPLAPIELKQGVNAF